MIAAFILYSVLLSALVAAAAWLIEVALAACGKARRQAWLAGIAIALGLPLGMAVLQSASPVKPVVSTVTMIERAAPSVITTAAPVVATMRVAGTSLDSLAFGAWGIASFALLSYYGISLWRLARHARRWPTHRFGTHSVTVAQDVGPAVFGWLQPRVVFPRWLLSAPAETQRMALLHEREHLIVRDPQILTTATLLFALFPWNVPLAWMLRRLRFAMEVDCDARVVRGGADLSSYGEALLYVSQRQAPAPATSIALIERPSQLERRINIMFASPRRFPALVASLTLALAASCLFAATKIEAPVKAPASEPLRPPPGLGTVMKLGEVFEQLLQTKYPGLLESKVEGTAMVVVLVNPDWSIARSEKVISPESLMHVPVNEATFAVLGLDEKSVPYVGNLTMQSPKDTKKKVLVAYTERATPGERFISKLFPDTRAVDREIFQRNFPDAVARGVPAGQSPWVLLDRTGRVVRSGLEEVKADRWNWILGRRFKGIGTESFTVTPITDATGAPILDRGGKALQLNCTWLAPDSPLPAT